MKEGSDMKGGLSFRLYFSVLLTLLLASSSITAIPASKRTRDQERASDETRKLTLQEIVAAERANRAADVTKRTGVRVLFKGPCATEKRVAAEYLARESGSDLYRVDLSTIVSKYIGETEKNLRRVFEAAEARHSVLFFDEADALFGKRSDVKDSHDRFASIEVSYILRRIEEYKGIAILATSHKDNIDRPFLRRIRFVVHFCN